MRGSIKEEIREGNAYEAGEGNNLRVEGAR